MSEEQNSESYTIEFPHKIFSIIRKNEELHVSNPDIDKSGVYIELEIHPELEKSINAIFDSTDEKTEFIEYSYLYSIYSNRIEEFNSLQNDFNEILDEKAIDLAIKNNLKNLDKNEIEKIKNINNQLKEIDKEVRILKERMNSLSERNNFDKKIEKNKDKIKQTVKKSSINDIKDL